LVFADGQGVVHIRLVAKGEGHEEMARDLPHRLQDPFVPDVPGFELFDDHGQALSREYFVRGLRR